MVPRIHALCPKRTGAFFIAWEKWKEEGQMERAMNCLRCGTEMVRLGMREFQLGRETRFVDSHRWEGSMELEVFGCPSCGKVEFFSEKTQEWAAEYECPVCHARYPRDAERCPKCFTKREK